MISLSVLFWIFVIIFAMVGAMRGWAKEMLVTFGVFVAIFMITIMENFIPFLQNAITPDSKLWVRLAVLGLMVFFSYQGPNIPRVVQSGKFVRDTFQDILLGIFLGAVNGYLVFGTAWYYIHAAGYPFDWILAPDQLGEAGQKALTMINWLPPQYLTAPLIYIVVAVSFVFVLVVFI